MQTTIVALDNITLSTEQQVDPAALLALGEVQNHLLEESREEIAKVMVDCAVFGAGAFTSERGRIHRIHRIPASAINAPSP